MRVPAGLLVLCTLACAMDVTDYEAFTRLDVRLTRNLQRPELKYRDDVTEDLNYFILVTEQLSQELTDNDHSSANCTTPLYRYGKPNFLKNEADEAKLFRAFKWKKSDIKLFRFQLENCVQGWLNFKKAYIEYKLKMLGKKLSY